MNDDLNNESVLNLNHLLIMDNRKNVYKGIQNLIEIYLKHNTEERAKK